MPKPQPWYAQFNQPPKGNPHHGRNRKPTPPTYRYPTRQPDPRDDRADAFDYTSADWAYQTIALPSFTPPPIPYAGVRAGEIIGHRMWYVTPNGLCSIAHHRIWQPGETVIGDINEEVGGAPWYKSIYGGVYAFATEAQVCTELQRSIKDVTFPTIVAFSAHFVFNAILGVAIGTVKLWGEVIEHEHGYRASHAKLNSLGSVIGQADLLALRERYLPNGS